MTIFNGETLLAYFPFTLVMIMLELLMTSYKSEEIEWTLKHAVSNLVVNVMWIALLFAVIMNPNIFSPEFIPYLSNLYDQSIAKTTYILNTVMGLIAFAVIVTNTIDTYTGFVNCKTSKKSDQV
ncbi:hypothetical protein [Sporosarcina sp. HYO08]|uniref:hypothetical protein n=1 Tax=Sporosarcina sp. HYO08 TaxID=1759557 RepID=UPI00079C208F|nr:hypothetical protein [Sporosarcina sp. HYO08]KXH87120.1 hypothetical protein AU377_00650 [Sporosarcina sp. HYO08]